MKKLIRFISDPDNSQIVMFLSVIFFVLAGSAAIAGAATALHLRQIPFVQNLLLLHFDLGKYGATLYVLWIAIAFARPDHSRRPQYLASKKIHELSLQLVAYLIFVALWGDHPFIASISLPVLLAFAIYLSGVRSALWLAFAFVSGATFAFFSRQTNLEWITGNLLQLISLYALISSVVFLVFSLRQTTYSENYLRILLLAFVAMGPYALAIVEGNSSKHFKLNPVPAVNTFDALHYLTSLYFIGIMGLQLRFMRRLKRTLIYSGATLAILIAAVFFATRAELDTRRPLPRRMLIRPSDYSQLSGMISPGDHGWILPYSSACTSAGCHPGSISSQHDLSAHGRAMTNEAFKVQLSQFIRLKGRKAADYCLSCHAPLGVLYFPGDGTRGKVVDPISTNEPAFTIGVGCVVCHLATPEKDIRKIGNASLELHGPDSELTRYLYPIEDDRYKPVVRAVRSIHVAQFRIPLRKADAVCGACHVVKLPANLSVDGSEKLDADHYLSFRSSPYAKAGLSCASCHQQKYSTFMEDYIATSHFYPGSGSSLPYSDTKSDTLFRAISYGYLNGIGIRGLTADAGELPLCLGDLNHYSDTAVLTELNPRNSLPATNGGLIFRPLLATSVAPPVMEKDSVRISISTRNECVGHTFPSGGGIKGYMEAVAYDGRGKEIGRYGGLDPTTGLPYPLPTNLGSRAVDSEGNPIRDRKFWEAKRVTYERTIKPAETITDTVSIPLKIGSSPHRIAVWWNYLRPEYLRDRERGIATSLAKPSLIGFGDIVQKNGRWITSKPGWVAGSSK